MPYCPSCGAQHPQGATYCPECGLAVGAGAPVGAPPPPPLPTVGLRDKPRTVDGLATALMVLFGVALLLSLGGAIKTWSLLRVIDGIPESGGGFGDVINVDSALSDSSTFLALSVLVAVALLILLIIFTYRIHQNIDAFGGTNTRLSHGWAIGGWFVPLANFVLPLLCLIDADQGAHLEPGGDTNIRRAKWSRIILVWWLLFSAGYVLNFIGTTTAVSLAPVESQSVEVGIVDNPTDAFGAYSLVLVGQVLLLAAAVAAVKAIHTIWRNQKRQIERLGQVQPEVAPLGHRSLVPGWDPTATSSIGGADRSTIAPPSAWSPPPPPPTGGPTGGQLPPPPGPGTTPSGEQPPPPPPPT